MINLLPPEEKYKILSGKKEKLATLLGTVVLVCLVCLILILLSIKFYILAETDYQKRVLEQSKKEYQTTEFMNLNSVVKQYNKRLAQLDSFYKKEIYFNRVLDTINQVPAPKGVYFTNILLSRNKTGTVQVNVSGTSDTRDNLIIFKQSIENEESLQNPLFSPESWVSPLAVKFSLTAQLSQNEAR